MGGLCDRRGIRLLCFDADGTRQAVIQRALPGGEEYLPGARRLAQACAPGYRGRKRGDVVRTRMTVQQAHTSEWLGTFSAPGNGTLGPFVEQVLGAVSTYLATRAWPTSQTLLRFDGEHGRFAEIFRLIQSGMGFVVRGVVYSLLKHPRVYASLAAGTTVSLRHPDTGVTRQIFDVPQLEWRLGDQRCTIRVIVTRSRKHPLHPVRVGKLIDGWIYELIATNADPASLHAVDIVSMYLHRGQFEGTLAQEDQEVPTDRWISHSPHGEEIWQIVCQWVWNLHLWLGLRTSPQAAVVRTTEFTPRIEVLAEPVVVTHLPEEPSVQTPNSTNPPEEPSAQTLEWSEQILPDPKTCSTTDPGFEPPSVVLGVVMGPPSDPAGRVQQVAVPSDPSGNDHNGDAASTPLIFQRDSEGTMRCPAGQPMRAVETVRLNHTVHQRLQVAKEACTVCALRIPCRGTHADSSKGRRISVAKNQARLQLHGPSLRVQTRPRVKLATASIATREKTENVVVHAEPTRPAIPGTQIVWNDLAARWIRNQMLHGLQDMKVEIVLRAPDPQVQPVQTEPPRDRRAHRRHTWLWSIQRNRLHCDQPQLGLRIYGIPRDLANYLGIPAPS